MASGSYNLGSTVRIPFQITDGGVAISTSSPMIEKVVGPSGVADSGFPDPMIEVDAGLGTYEYRYSPKAVGDYIVIISVELDGETYVSIENFTVKSAANSSSGCSKTVPRAESR